MFLLVFLKNNILIAPAHYLAVVTPLNGSFTVCTRIWELQIVVILSYEKYAEN